MNREESVLQASPQTPFSLHFLPPTSKDKAQAVPSTKQSWAGWQETAKGWMGGKERGEQAHCHPVAIPHRRGSYFWYCLPQLALE